MKNVLRFRVHSHIAITNAEIDFALVMLSIGLIPILTTVNANVNARSSLMCEQILKAYLRPAKTTTTCRLY